MNNTAPGEFRTIQVKRDLSEKQARPIVIEMDCKYVVSHGAGEIEYNIGTER